MNTENEKLMILELGITEDGYEFASDIKTALNIAEADLDDITIRISLRYRLLIHNLSYHIPE